MEIYSSSKLDSVNERRFLPLTYDKGDRENVFCMLAVYQLRLSANQVVHLCQDMQPLHQAHSPNWGARCHHLFYFDIGKYALKIGASKDRNR